MPYARRGIDKVAFPDWLSEDTGVKIIQIGAHTWTGAYSAVAHDLKGLCSQPEFVLDTECAHMHQVSTLGLQKMEGYVLL